MNQVAVVVIPNIDSDEVRVTLARRQVCAARMKQSMSFLQSTDARLSAELVAR